MDEKTRAQRHNNQTSQTSFLLLLLFCACAAAYAVTVYRREETHLRIRVCCIHVFVSLHVYHLAPAGRAAARMCGASAEGLQVYVHGRWGTSRIGGGDSNDLCALGWGGGCCSVGSEIERLTFRRRRNNNINTRNAS